MSKVAPHQEIQGKPVRPPPRTYGEKSRRSRVWRIPIRIEKFGKAYSSQVTIDLSSWSRSSSWMYEWLTALEREAQAVPQPFAAIQRLNVSVRAAKGHTTFCTHAARQITTLSSAEVHEIFTAVEESLLVDPIRSKSNCSSAFRGLFWKFAYRIGLPSRVTIASVAFQTRLVGRRDPKALLGDYADILPPLGATEHTDVADLKAKLRSRAEGALRQLQDAAISDLEMGRRLRSFLTDCANAPIDVDFLEKVQRLICLNPAGQFAYRRSPYPEVLDDMHQFVGATLIQIRANGLVKHVLPYSTKIAEFLRGEAGWNGSTRGLMFALQHASATEVHAAGALVHSHTGWNLSASLELDISQVRRHGSMFEIQSYKGKTDTNTPPVILSDQDPGAIQALELLLWNHRQLIALGLKPANEGRLWYDLYGRREDRRPEPQWVADSLRQRHSLPPFTLEMLRRQRSFIEGLSDAEHAREVAGHKTLATTTVYLNTDIAQRLNSSINLQMQRRLEKELAYSMGLSTERPSWKLLLHPIGDGASCVDPTVPPHRPDNAGAMCDARDCHVGYGCSNRRIVIDEERMREVIITSRMYRESWKRLHTRNAIEFSKYHVPALLFNAALVRLLKSGQYANVFRRLENECVAESADN